MAKRNPYGRVEMDGKWYRIKKNGNAGVELTHNSGTETFSEHMGKIRAAIRKASQFWKPAQDCLGMASRPYTGKDKRIKKEYKCKTCKKWFVRGKVEANHIVECGSLTCYEDIPQFCYNVFKPHYSAYEVLCKPCHRLATNKQIKARKERKNGIKQPSNPS